jgi:hypothetical protein
MHKAEILESCPEIACEFDFMKMDKSDKRFICLEYPQLTGVFNIIN